MTTTEREAQRRQIEAFVLNAMDDEVADAAPRLPSPRALKAADDSSVFDGRTEPAAGTTSLLSGAAGDASGAGDDPGRAKRMRRRSSSLQPPRRRTTLESTRRELEADRASLRARERSVGPPKQPKTPLRAPPESSTTPTSGGAAGTPQSAVVVTGASRSGKTQLAETLAFGAARQKPPPTVGVERHDVHDLCVWDTSGDARFDESTLGLARVANAVVVVYAASSDASFEVARKRATFAAGLRDTTLLIVATTEPSAARSFAERDAAQDAETTIVETEKAPEQAEEDHDTTPPQGQQADLVVRGRKLAALLGAPFFSIDPTDKTAVDALFARIRADLAKRKGSRAPSSQKLFAPSGAPAVSSSSSSRGVPPSAASHNGKKKNGEPPSSTSRGDYAQTPPNAARSAASSEGLASRASSERLDLDGLQADLFVYASALAVLFGASVLAGLFGDDDAAGFAFAFAADATASVA